MPVKQCQDNGKPGLKWGDAGKCYTYSPYNEGSRRNANKQAIAQGLAIGDFAEIGERGGVKESKKAPKSDTPNKDPQGEGTAKGSASTTRGAEVPKAIEENLQKKSNDFNERYKDKLGYGVNLGMLKSVYQRGVGAYNVSHSPAVKSSQQWALARVNAFLYIVKNGRPENSKYTGDNDLLPKGHPKSDKNGMAGVRVSFDYDDTLTTKKGLELLRKELDDKNIIYIISARQRKSGMLPLALRYNIPGNRVFATGSNQNKVDKLKELKIAKHYDNSQEVIDIAKDKQGLTTKVIKI
jgi:hypothetical protein